jgi:N-acetylglutamate synthase-like GNAT family acetyltransferase
MPLNNITLRQAGSQDWPAIEGLLQANKLPVEGARDHLQHFLLATQGREVVGCAGAELYGDVALLRSVAVAPGLHKIGIGRDLVEFMLAEARRRGVHKLYLLTVTAPEYFAQYGFKRIARDQVPASLKASQEFQGACPACAALMELTLVQVPESAPANLPVAVLGAGPVGLAAAARLIERGIEPLILEAGESVGANLLDFGHVRLFSPWRYNVDAAMADQLAPTGWRAPPAEDLPFAIEVVRHVLQPYARIPRVAAALRLRTRVNRISRDGFDKVKTAGREKSAFVIHAIQDGQPVIFRARAVIDATGTWNTPNPLGANGLVAEGEEAFAHRIAYGIPDVLGRDMARYAGKRTLVVGAGHSAANALLALADLARSVPQTRLAWAVRSPVLQRVFGGGTDDALPARGRLGSELRALRDNGGLEFVSGLHITALREEGGAITVEGADAQGRLRTIAGIDEIICATGQRPELRMVSELRVRLDPMLESTEALAPLIDPNVHSCGSVRPHGHRELAHPEPGFYTLGVKSYGRAPTFLMATGFEQARSVAAAIAGDLAAADLVELDLPETGVCGIGTEEVQAGVPLVAASCGSGGCGVATSLKAAPAAPAQQRAACCG